MSNMYNYITRERLKRLLDYNPASGVFIRVSISRNDINRVGEEAGCLDSNGYRIILLLGRSYYNLGAYINIEDAIAARKRGELRHYGE